MAQCDADTIFKALRLVPDFDGNANVLPRFIKLCDQLCETYISTAPNSELSNQFLLNGILNKITGNAARTINSNGIPSNWAGIRNALINNFSDQRDETALYNDLFLAIQGNQTPQEYFDHCQNLFSTIMTYVTLHETVQTTIDAKRDLYKKLTMQAFVRGLNEPLGSRIRCMRPDSAEKALEFVQEELNVMYLQQRNDSVSNKKIFPPKPIQMAHFSMPSQRPFVPSAPMPMFNNVPFQRPIPQNQQPWKPYFPMNPIHRPPQGPSRTQQMFSAPPPNYRPQSNIFRMQPRYQPQYQPQNAGPKPMSGVSTYVAKSLPPAGLSGHNWAKSGNPPPSNYFKTREMNFNECFDNDYSYYPATQYFEPEYYYVNDNDYTYIPPDMYNCNDQEHYEPGLTDTTNDDPQDYDQTPFNNPEQDFLKGQTSRKSKWKFITKK